MKDGGNEGYELRSAETLGIKCEEGLQSPARLHGAESFFSWTQWKEIPIQKQNKQWPK